MPHQDGHVTTPDGVRLYYEALGAGPRTLVVPNGFHLRGDFARVADRRRLVFYDLRNRGKSDAVADPARLARGLHQDADDLEAVRTRLGLGKIDVLTHSYAGWIAVLWAARHPAAAGRLALLGPSEPNHGKSYPAHLTGADETLRATLARLGELQKERGSADRREFCRKFWSVLRVIYVTDAADAHRIDWGRCEEPNELGALAYFNAHVLPSLRALDPLAEGVGRVRAPVLVVHGRQDRSAPYGGAREWAMLLPDARLVTIPRGGHAPWIESPETVFGALASFLDGAWPAGAERVRSLEPRDRTAP
jgi:pimeloyl-ACP methyl ester carboxylesterase